MSYLPAVFVFTRPSSPTPAGEVQWDIFEEHQDECAYQLALWDRALWSPSYLLREVQHGPEQAWLREESVLYDAKEEK